MLSGILSALPRTLSQGCDGMTTLGFISALLFCLAIVCTADVHVQVSDIKQICSVLGFMKLLRTCELTIVTVGDMFDIILTYNIILRSHI